MTDQEHDGTRSYGLCDPLELLPESTLGVPGLVDATRAGRLVDRIRAGAVVDGAEVDAVFSTLELPDEVVFRDDRSRDLLAQIRRVAETDLPVLLEGENWEEVGELTEAAQNGENTAHIAEEAADVFVTAIGVCQIQERMNGDKYLFPICQFRLTLEGRIWHLYWMRKFDAWWPYPPPETGRKYTLRARMQQVLEDDHGCFWG